MTALLQVPLDARCALHPDAAAAATCRRCGGFICAEDVRLVDTGVFCPACSEHPDVDYLEGFRRKMWGRRDGWAWFVGFQAVAMLVLGAVFLLAGDVTQGVALAALGVPCAAYWWGWAPMRALIFVVPTGNLLVGALLNDQPFKPQALWGFAIYAAAYANPRSKLFFKQDVDRDALKRTWNLYSNNSIARRGFALSILGLLLPVLSPVALLLSWVGLRRVDPTAVPPIGRKKQAVAGIVMGAIGCVEGVALLVYVLATR